MPFPLFSILILLIFCAVAVFSGPITAYEWPSLDMFPFYLAATETNVLTHDFFTQCSLSPNPRHISGYLVLMVHKVLGIHWYDVLIAIKYLSYFLLPVGILCALSRLFETLSPNTKKSSAFAFILALLIVPSLFGRGEITDLFTVAWWQPLTVQAIAHTMSLLVSFWAIFFFLGKSKSQTIISGCLVLITFLVHPQIGLFTVANLVLIGLIIHKYWPCLLTLLAGLCSYGVLTVFLTTGADLSAADFTHIYANLRHSRHYIPSDFQSFHGGPWLLSVALVNAFTLAGAFYHYIKKRLRLAAFFALITLGYDMALLAQYLMVEIWPIKLITQIGPSRYTLFGYWWSCFALASIWADVPIPNHSKKLRPSNALFLGGAFLILSASAVGIWALRDDMQTTPINRNGEILQWIENNTPIDSIFIAPPNGGLRTDIPIITKRAVFYGNGFPFTENCFTEYAKRNRLIADKPNWALYQKLAHEYQPLHEYQALYVIVKPSDNLQERNFPADSVVYQNKNYAIYTANQ